VNISYSFKIIKLTKINLVGNITFDLFDKTNINYDKIMFNFFFPYFFYILLRRLIKMDDVYDDHKLIMN